jgi:hypothetical protein
MYEVPDGGSTLAAEPRKVIRQACRLQFKPQLSRHDLLAFLRLEQVADCADLLPQCGVGSGGGFPDQGFQF